MKPQGELFAVEEMTNLRGTDWRPPRPADLPRKLDGPIAVDLETNDRGLSSGCGRGWAWPDGGYVVGYAISTRGFKAYLPIAHAGGGNIEPADAVRDWLNEILSDPKQPKIFANAQYDIGWARRDGVEIAGPIIDVQWAEALLDEHRLKYSLESIARDRLGVGKDESLLREAAAAYGVDPKSGMWQLPARYVGPYAEADADLTRRVWEEQVGEIIDEGLKPIFDLEHSLLPLYLDMTARGVRIDVDAAERLRDRLAKEAAAIMVEVSTRTGVRLESPWNTADIARAFDTESIPYGRTPKSNKPSITRAGMEAIDHWLPRSILAARAKDKLAGTFVNNVILGHLRGGRVHGEIHPLKSVEGGTVSGRLSMSNPNLQFIPVRTPEGKEIRRLFLPEPGERWASLDFSQQEPRLTVHFAALTQVDGRPLPGAIEARDRYRNDPDMSYHEFASEITGLPYSQAKTLNLAIIYGRGIASTAAELGIGKDEAQRMFDKHHKEMPFARALAEVCQRAAGRRGEIRSLLGRKSRFPFWEPAAWDDRDDRSLRREAAERAWPGKRLVRSRIHKALNSLIQPSAADQTKAAMKAVWDAGLGGRIMVQVHDELCCSVPDDASAREIAGLMKNAIALEVPSKVDIEISDRWEGER